MLDLVDIINQNEVWLVRLDAAENPALVVPNCASQLFVRLELVEWVSVEGKIEESFRIVTSLDAMVNELVEERGFPDASPSNEAEKRLVLELAAGLVGTGKIIEIALLPCRE
jgi:hypothetical protein